LGFGQNFGICLESGLKIALGFFRTFDFVKIVAILILNNLSLTVLVRHKVYLQLIDSHIENTHDGGKGMERGKEKERKRERGSRKVGIGIRILQGSNPRH
jgi:hypothetical protein